MKHKMDQQTPKPDYDFITQAGEQKKGFLVNADKKTRIMVVVGGIGILLIIGAIFAAIIFGGRTDLSQELLRVAQRQQEIIRVSEIGEENARSRNTSVLATTTKYSITSSQQPVVNRLRSLGLQAPASILGATENDNTTDELEQANQANRFDEAFRENMAGQLDAYEQAIRTSAEHASGSDIEMLRELLEELELIRENL